MIEGYNSYSNNSINKTRFQRLMPIYKLMTGTMISFIGDQIYMIALPWIVYNITGSVAQMATVTAIGKIPNIFQPITGALVDRFNKKKLLLICDAIESTAVCSMGFLYLAGGLEIWHIYLATIFLGFLGQIYNAAKFSAIPLLVENNDLHFVNSLDSGIYNMGILIGPSIGGAIITLYNPGYALLLNGISFLGTLITTLSIDIPGNMSDNISEEEKIKGAEKECENTSLLKELENDLKVGFQFVFKNPILLHTNVALIFSTIGTTLFLTVMFFYLQSVICLDAQQVGILLSIGGIGAMLGSIFTNYLLKYLSYINVIIIGFIVGGSSIIIFGSVESYLLLTLSNALGTFAVSLINPCVATIRQSITPKHLLGRVQATSKFMTWTLIPVSAYLSGLLSNYFGTSTTIVLGGVIQMTASLILFRISRRNDF
ncbi:MAG: MFS transporter [Clostridiaceae bacterium]